MLRLCLSGLMLMAWLLTACASVGEGLATETPLPPAATQRPPSEPSATPMPALTPTPISDGQTPVPGQLSEYAPQPGDSVLTRGNAFVEESGVLFLESFPPQFRLSLLGTVPTPCHELRVVFTPPDAKHQIAVDVYTVVNPDLLCMQVIAPFSATVSLEGYIVGPTYTVIVNGMVAGEFTPQAP